jgi:hypothetical protein
MENKSIVEILAEVQSKLKAPKSQYNSFGKYNYRNCEDILEALKPILSTYKAIVIVSDEIVAVADRVYVKASAIFSVGGLDKVTATAFAREPKEQKGMNEAQITGSASSYARKYALNGLFLIDDTKDADSTNDHGKAPSAAQVLPSHGIDSKHSADIDGLKAAAEKAKQKYTGSPIGDEELIGDEWKDEAPKPKDTEFKTITGIIKKYYPLNGKKPYCVAVDGEFYSSYHDGIGEQMAQYEHDMVVITYRDEPYVFKGEDRINHIVQEIKQA